MTAMVKGQPFLLSPPRDHPARGRSAATLRAMRAKARDGFIKALRDAHRWLDELLVDPTQTIESLAIREGKSERSIRMTLSLGFISPALAEAAMEGRLPRGFCIKRLTDLPMLWSEQSGAIGLQARLRFEPNSADPSRRDRHDPRKQSSAIMAGDHDGANYKSPSCP